MFTYSFNKHLILSQARDWDPELGRIGSRPPSAHTPGGDGPINTATMKAPQSGCWGVRMEWRPRVGMVGAGSQMGLRDE